jgi:phage FluMu protein Com
MVNPAGAGISKSGLLRKELTMDPRKSPEPESGNLRDERCECGNLICKISEETVEIKCRRCKRIHIVPIERLVKKADD